MAYGAMKEFQVYI